MRCSSSPAACVGSARCSAWAAEGSPRAEGGPPALTELLGRERGEVGLARGLARQHDAGAIEARERVRQGVHITRWVEPSGAAVGHDVEQPAGCAADDRTLAG